MNSNIQLEVVHLEKINFSMQQNAVPAIQCVFIDNKDSRDWNDVELEIRSEPEFLQPFSRPINVLPAGTKTSLEKPEIVMNMEYLASLTESIEGVLIATLRQNGEILCEKTSKVRVLAYDEWAYRPKPELMAAFVTPNHPFVAKICSEASRFLKTWTGDPSLDGYLSHNPDRTRKLVAAVYAAMQQLGITYVVPPASFENTGQRVRLCDTIVQQRMGTCLDLSFLFASCFEFIGLHPLLILLKEHCFAGVWLDEKESFTEMVADDSSLLTKRIGKGNVSIVLVECTAVTVGRSSSFEQAEDLAAAHLVDAEKFVSVVDVKRARVHGVKPLPSRVLTKEGWKIVPNESSENDPATAPTDLFRTTLDTNSDQKTESKSEIWARRLLDLTLRNSLLNLRLTRKTIPIMSEDLGSLEDGLASGTVFQLLPKPSNWQPEENADYYEMKLSFEKTADLLKLDRESDLLRTTCTEHELEQSTSQLFRAARTAQEENGANTLYLALGLLRWFDSSTSAKARYAPIVLLPVDLVRISGQKGFKIRARDEDTQINVTLLEMLRTQFNVDVNGLDPLPLDEHGVDLLKIFAIIRKSILPQKRWDVVENAFLGIFSFSQFVMWNDVKNNLDELAKNRIVSSLMEGKLTWEPEQLTDDVDLESEILSPIPADASQMKAIYAAGLGRSFVLHGPPGTGKSQTITNMIAHALAQGKRVLFVAEKMAALSVVQRRLEKIGLGPFCLELHSNKATKKGVLDQLEQTLNVKKLEESADFDASRRRLALLRGELSEYVHELHRLNPSGFSLYEMIERFETVPKDALLLDEISSERILSATGTEIADWMEVVTRFSQQTSEVESPQTHPFRAVALAKYSQQFREDLTPILDVFGASISPLCDAELRFVERFSESHPVTQNEWELLVRLAEGIPLFLDLPEKWRKMGDLGILCDELERLQSLNDLTNSRKQELLKEFTPSFLQFDAASAIKNWEKFFILWPQSIKVGELPENIYRYSNQKESYENLKNLAEQGTEMLQKMEVLKKNWKDSFFAQDSEQLLREFQTHFEQPKNQTVDALPAAWWNVADFGKFLLNLQLLCESGPKNEELAAKLCESWASAFLNQNGAELQAKWMQIHASNFVLRYFRHSAFVHRLSAWAKKPLTDPFITEALDLLVTFQNKRSEINSITSGAAGPVGMREALQTFRTAGSFRWSAIAEGMRIAKEYPEETKKHCEKAAFRNRMAAMCKQSSVSETEIFEALQSLEALQKLQKILNSFLSKNQTVLEAYNTRKPNGEKNVSKSTSIDWSRLKSNCKIILENFEEFQWFVREMPLKRAFENTLKNEFKRAFLKQTQITSTRMLEILKEIAEFQSIQAEFSQLHQTLADCLEGLSFGKSLTEQIQKARLGWKPFVGILAERAAKITKICIPEDVETCMNPLVQAWNNFEHHRSHLFIFLKIDEQYIDYSNGYIEGLKHTLECWTSNITAIRPWILCQSTCAALRADDLGVIAHLWLNGRPSEMLAADFQKTLLKVLIRDCFEKSTILNGFSGDSFERTILLFKTKDAEFAQLTQEEIRSRLSARIPNLSQIASGSSEPAILQRTICGKGRGTSIRRLFEQIPNLLERLCPCMLMSPISVAQYLAPSREPFDLVIFDEASQLPTCKAVGTLARGKNAIVVGDPKQLPPTNFFEVNTFDEENPDLEDLESILDDCLALSMPETHLLWHYRSQHESLIAFSNMEYYENRLMTFPSAGDKVSRVHYVEVNGFYDRSNSRTNRAEAEAIVADIIRRLRDPELAKRSIGIVTFSTVQQNLIEDLLADAFRLNPTLDEAANSGDEPIFVKNLENVQGDERDVILFSIGYGPDKNGKVSYNFGPLNKEGGWRRLNVAVSRARYEMTVFSTLRYDQIDLSATASQGVAGLRNFLEFAKNGRVLVNINRNLRRTAPDGIGRLICEHLREKGFEVRQNIGRSDFRIDVGVVHPKDPNRYLLGILLDGENYRSALTVRDREVARVNVLQNLEWHVHRLWSVDWWDDRTRELEKIDAAIQNALNDENPSGGFDDSGNGTDGPNSPDLPDLPDCPNRQNASDDLNPLDAPYSQDVSEPPAPSDAPSSANSVELRFGKVATVFYEVTKLEEMTETKDSFYRSSTDDTIFAQMNAVLQKEAPIEKDVFYRRISSAWGFGRFGSRIETRLAEILKRLEFQQTEVEDCVFLWTNAQNPEEFQTFRPAKTQSDGRDAQDFPPQELAALAVEKMNSLIGIEQNDLITEINKFMGFSSSASSWVALGIDWAVKKGRLKRDGTYVSLP